MTNQTYDMRDEILNDMEKVKQENSKELDQEIKEFNKNFEEFAESTDPHPLSVLYNHPQKWNLDERQEPFAKQATYPKPVKKLDPLSVLQDAIKNKTGPLPSVRPITNKTSNNRKVPSLMESAKQTKTKVIGKPGKQIVNKVVPMKPPRKD